MKNKIFKIFGAAVAVFILLSSITPVYGIQNEKNLGTTKNGKNSNLEDEIFVQPNIVITKAKLPMLKKTLQKIEDPLYKELTQKIIEKIEAKGIVKSTDIKDILIDLNMLSTDVYFGNLEGNACCNSGAGGFPFIPSILILRGAWWLGPALFVSWYADTGGWASGRIDFTIAGHHIDYQHKGLALFLPFVLWLYSTGFDPQYGVPGSSMSIIGWAMLIFITT